MTHGPFRAVRRALDKIRRSLMPQYLKPVDSDAVTGYTEHDTSAFCRLSDKRWTRSRRSHAPQCSFSQSMCRLCQTTPTLSRNLVIFRSLGVCLMPRLCHECASVMLCKDPFRLSILRLLLTTWTSSRSDLSLFQTITLRQTKRTMSKSDFSFVRCVCCGA